MADDVWAESVFNKTISTELTKGSAKLSSYRLKKQGLQGTFEQESLLRLLWKGQREMICGWDSNLKLPEHNCSLIASSFSCIGPIDVCVDLHAL